VFSALTVNDNSTLGSSNSDTVNFNARVASDINPATDDTYDLGVTGHEWRNLNIDGTANIDSLVADTADINGGTIDGTAIGATTPSTIAGTTLTTSSTVTINGGSTNSVAYLNSSKVLTTGSALTFDGTNLGVGNADATTVNNNNGSGTLVVGVNSGSTGMTILSGASSGNQARLTFANATTGAGSYSAQIGYVSGDNALVIYNANTERMRIDSSGNVGIGTASPANRLDVSDGQATVKIGSSTTSAGNEPVILLEHAGNNAFQIKGGANLIFSSDTGTNERMRITTAGDVGIGTTTPGSKLDVNGELRIGNTVNTVSPTSPDRTITMVIGGTTYYIHAKTTND